ncbi:MAG: MFS transporter [Clostridia bacterium]
MNTKEMEKLTTNPDYIPVKEKVVYGIGSLMDGGGVALMSCVMLKYMTSIGIAAAIASTIMMIAKLWDAFTDPLMGHITDNTRSRFGRRKPYMVVGGFLLLIALVFLFAPVKRIGITAGHGLEIYVLIFYIVWNTCSTITQVPYCSLASDISPDFKERNNANTIKLIFNAISSGISYLVPLLLLEAYVAPDQALLPQITDIQFWLIISLVFGSAFGGGLILCGIFVKERINVPIDTPKVKFNWKKFLANYGEPFKNKSFRWHIVMYASAFMCMDVISCLAVFYATDVWHGSVLFGMNFSSMFIIAPLMISAVIAFPIARVLMDKKSKQFAFRMGLPFYIIGGIMLAIVSPSWAPPILVPIVAAVMGLGFGGAQMMPWIIFPDTVDVGEFKTGDRPTGSYSGMMTLIRKIAGAFGVGMVGWVLSFASYKVSDTNDYIQQSPQVLITIRILMGGAIAILISIALIASFKYKVTNKKLTRIRYFIEKRKAGLLDEMTEEEKSEREALIKELC